MLQRFLTSFKNDCRYIVRDRILLAAALYPLLVIMVLRLAFFPLSDLILLKTGFRLEPYYTIFAITLISAVPAFWGFIYAFIYLEMSKSSGVYVISIIRAENKSFLQFSTFVPALSGFFFVLFAIIICDPVPSEGWLRSFFISLLLSLQSLFVLLVIVRFAQTRVKGILMMKLYGIFVAAIPLGLLLHHPWNYLIFFSPLYWMSWAWVTISPAESLLYGSISAAITAGSVFLIFRNMLQKVKT